MPAFESIVVVEDWISEHYFTTDGNGVTFQKAVLELRKGWDADAKEGHSTVLKRFSATRADLQTQMAALGELTGAEALEHARAVYAQLREVLGFAGEPATQRFERGATDTEVSALWVGDTQDVLWIDGTPAAGDDALTEARVLGENTQGGKPQDQPLAKLLSELYQSEPSPNYIVVAVGSSLFLTDRERWPEGRYLSADVQLIADRNDSKKGGEVDRLLAIFGRQSVMPAADGTIWWDGRLEESRQHAVGVSKDLRDGIRESIEIIANDVLIRRTAQGLSNEDVDGQRLARQSLRFLYRILFLLYAEASPELGVLPKGAGEYDAGYGLDRLRELVQVDLPTQQSQRGTHLYESLDLLFRLVNGDHAAQNQEAAQASEQLADVVAQDEGLTFEPLEADLFAPRSTSLIGEVGLGNAELQRVLERLLLSKASSKGDRGFISYANLGINQLGAVYEGLLSYTGFIAKDDLREVAKNGDASKGSWVVPVDRIDSIAPKHYVRRPDENGLLAPVHHPKGSFVFRLAGRERQQSASYYTPEMLTKFVVSQALEELLDDETPADRILELSVCEPALGSGAFAIEAVRQLADEYLKRKQKELDQQIPADEYAAELQKVKAQIALHQVHGVDLNATAVELAEVSLWLDTMQPGLSAPWFGLRLKRGNSLIGTRRATYSAAAVMAKAYLKEEPHGHPLTGLVEALEADGDDPTVAGRIHHFLLPGEGWGAAADAKEVKDLAADEQKKLKAWAKSTKVALKNSQIKRLQALSERVEVLWKIALRRLQIAESQAQRSIKYWGKSTADTEPTTVTRAEIEAALDDPEGAYRRLRRVMDAWNALWFWPLTEAEIQPPGVDEWLDALEGVLGLRGQANKTEGQQTLIGHSGWHELNDFEQLDLGLATAMSTQRLDDRFPWLSVCDRVAAEQGFFHWELSFASVFGRGGFDLQVGNPPWVRPRSDEAALLAEHDAWWQLTEKPSQALVRQKREETLALPGAKLDFVEAAVPTPVLAEFLGATSQYAVLAGLQPDLYRAFMARTWMSTSGDGVIALIHPESHFTEKKAHHLRAETYRRLRRHWQFINELHLFEIHNLVVYGVHIYGALQESPTFRMAASLYHPDTVARSMAHEGGTEVPGLKTADGTWDTRPHPERIVKVDRDVLKVWADILDEPGTSPLHARMVYPVNRASMSVLEKLSKAPRVRELGLQYSSGWHETADRKAGYFEVGSKVNESWEDVILQGPHFTVANPFAKEPNETMKSNRDYVDVDLEALPADFIPRTSYQPVRDGSVNYDADYSRWEIDGKKTSARDHFRIGWRRMASVTGVRTLYPTVLPPGAAHVHPVYSAGPFETPKQLLGQVGLLSALPSDFFVKVSGSSEIQFSLMSHMARFESKSSVARPLVERAARLVCVIEAYAPLWNEVMDEPWSVESPARIAAVRRQLQVELDALSALTLGLTADELCTIYRTQFPVLRGYEQNDLYDANGRKIPGEMNKLYRKVGEDGMTLADRQWTHPQSGVEYTFDLPFRGFDREEDMRLAYTQFQTQIVDPGEIQRSHELQARRAVV